MKRIRTAYSHLFDPDGRRRAKPCSGLMEIVCEMSGVYVYCDTCGEGYRFHFEMIKGDELASDGNA